MGSTVAVERATPAKRTRDKGASLAPAPEQAAGPGAVSGTQQAELRVRRRVASSAAAAGQGAAAPAAASQSCSVGSAAAQSCMAAAGSERRPLEAGLGQ